MVIGFLSRDMIINIIKNLHVKITSTNLPIYGIPAKYLKEFVTTQSDRKKHLSRVPDESYRIKAEDIIKEETDLTARNIMDSNKKHSITIYQRVKEDAYPILDDFKIIQVLGKGSFGKVFLVQRKPTGKCYAMKVLRKDVLIDTDQIENTKIENEILKRV
jgi:serum/glucocorticoid-regulated kinase 2